MLEQIEKIIVIVGCQRSGTTLLGQIMGAPRHALLLDESDVVSLQQVGGYEAWLPAAIVNEKHARPTLQKILAEAGQKYQDSDQRVVEADGQWSFAKDITQLILKAPNLTYSAADIAGLKKPINVIYALRNPVSVIASMLKLSHIDFVGNQLELIKKHPELVEKYSNDLAIMTRPSSSPALRSAHLWKIKSSLLSSFSTRNIPTTLCRYEDLVSKTRAVCESISNCLDIPFDERMLNHGDVYQGIAQGKTDRSRPVDDSSLNKWQGTIAPHELDQLRESISDAIIELGY